MTRKQTVSFGSGPIAIPPAEAEAETHHVSLSGEERRELWYSREELTNSCLEAKQIVNIINSVNGDYGAIDHSKVCVVGLEKFHGKKEREKYRKLLVKSVLIRQEMNRGAGRQDADCLCEISAMISNSFKEFALWQAAMHKFHANSSPDVSTKTQRPFETNNAPCAKRRKREQDFEYSTQTQDSPKTLLASNTISYTNHGQVRQETHQLMAEYCA
jgi:hypothetical protein